MQIQQALSNGIRGLRDYPQVGTNQWPIGFSRLPIRQFVKN